MKKYFEKFKKKFNQVLDYIKKNWLWLLALLIVLIQWNIMVDIISFNIKAFLLIFIPSFLLFRWFWKKAKDGKPFDKKSLLTTSGIILVIFFFLFKNFEINIDKVKAVQVANHHNCGIALGNIKLSELEENRRGDRFSLNYFIIEPYKENLELAIKYPELLDFTFLQEAYIKMESTNSLVRVVEELNILAADPFKSDNVRSIMGERNNDIINKSKEISKKICLKHIERKNDLESLIIKILNKLKF